jgi:hypothetical protein
VLEGQIYQPTILSNVPPDIAVANEETLGGKSHGHRVPPSGKAMVNP